MLSNHIYDLKFISVLTSMLFKNSSSEMISPHTVLTSVKVLAIGIFLMCFQSVRKRKKKEVNLLTLAPSLSLFCSIIGCGLNIWFFSCMVNLSHRLMASPEVY